MNSKHLTGIRNFKINFHQKKDKSLREQVIKKTLKPKKKERTNRIIKQEELKDNQKRVNPAKTNTIQRLIGISNNLTLNKFKTLTSKS